MNEVIVDVWGDFACFTQSDAKIERVSYDIATPSACRNILSAIYAEPMEFYYEIKSIEVMKPIRYIDIRKNEVKKKGTIKREKDGTIQLEHFPCVENMRTQRGTTYLKDVYYRIHALIHRREDCINKSKYEDDFVCQFNRRMVGGKCFYQPYLGMKECMCFFGPPNEEMKPIEESRDLGIMLYDIFNITKNTVLNTDKKNRQGCINPSYFHPYMINGIVNVPSYNSPEVYKE